MYLYICSSLSSLVGWIYFSISFFIIKRHWAKWKWRYINVAIIIIIIIIIMNSVINNAE